MPTYRNLWNSTQQLARRHLQEQNSNDLGTADADPTIRRPWSYANPYQLGRGRDASYAAIGQVREWQNSLRTSVDLGTADYDPTVTLPNIRPYPYQQQWRLRDTAYEAVRSFRSKLVVTLEDADPTVTRPTSTPYPYQLRWRSRDGAWEQVRAWRQSLQTSTTLGVADADPTIRPSYQAANPYQLRLGLSALPAINASVLQMRLWQASTPADPPVQPPPVSWTAANPYQLRWRDSTVDAIQATRAALIVRPGVTDVDYDPTLSRHVTNPYQLWSRTLSGAFAASNAFRFRLLASTPVIIPTPTMVHGCVDLSVTLIGGFAQASVAQAAVDGNAVMGAGGAAMRVERGTAEAGVEMTPTGMVSVDVEDC